jgi:lysozyme
MMTDDDLIQQLMHHEGFRSKPYKCTAGKLTIGYGRNLEDRGLSKDEALYLLLNDIHDAQKAVEAALPWSKNLTPARRGVLVNMAFNLGIGGLLKFKKMLAATEAGRYSLAAEEMLDSRWATQVGERALELADIMKTGLY